MCGASWKLLTGIITFLKQQFSYFFLRAWDAEVVIALEDINYCTVCNITKKMVIIIELMVLVTCFDAHMDMPTLQFSYFSMFWDSNVLVAKGYISFSSKFLLASNRRPDISEGLRKLRCRSLIFVGDMSPFHSEALHMTSKLDRRFSALVEVLKIVQFPFKIVQYCNRFRSNNYWCNYRFRHVDQW